VSNGTSPVGRRELLAKLAQRSLAEFLDDHCPQLAAAIAYHVLFSIFPLAIVLAGIFGIVVDATGVQADVVDAIVRNVPLSADGAARLRRLLEQSTGGLSALGLIGVVGLVYAASGMMASIRLALNEAWDVVEYRPFLRGKLIDVGLVFGTAVVAVVSVGLTIAARTAGDAAAQVGIDLRSGWVTWILAVAVPLVFSFGIVLFLYVTIPAVDVPLGDAWPGALLASCGFVLTENLFAVYVSHFANYNAIYGSLGAVVAFMFFVYLSSMVFLLGAEVASELPRVRRTLERGESEQGPPLSVQAREILKGLWGRRRQEENRREEERVER
jgi:membrane protein